MDFFYKDRFDFLINLKQNIVMILIENYWLSKDKTTKL